jgi:hypothetical protein
MPPGQTGGTGAGNNNANGSNGSAILLYMQLSAGSQPAYPEPATNDPGTGTRTVNTTTEDSINVTIRYRIDTVYPESTNLTNSWGTVTIDNKVWGKLIPETGGESTRGFITEKPMIVAYNRFDGRIFLRQSQFVLTTLPSEQI